ncbi:MAG: nucleotidyltransferase family protein [Ruminococcaceae bacterium]|nr:nucleotidyltransferase family protein [Oscillospiraceae bacterium]
MICLILAAGYATRLYPLTENFPKPLLFVNGKTILDWLVDDISKTTHIKRFIVISNHKFACHFESWAKASRHDITVVDDGTDSNENRLGAVRDIEFAIDKLGLDDDMLVIAGDNVLDFSLGRFTAYYKEKGSSCVMRYYEADERKLLKCGVVTIDGDERVTEMTEKSPTPATHWCTPPFYIYTREDAKKIKQALAEGCGYDAPGSFIAWLCHSSPVYSMEMPGSRYDIGNLESYNEVKNSYRGIEK